MTKTYLKTVYSEQRTPKTTYPKKLAYYLVSRFGLKQNDRIIELGCGRGDFINGFQSAGLNCFAVDRELSDGLNSQVEFKKVDLGCESIPYPDDFFDVVYHKSVLEHFYSPDQLMTESLRILKPGGKLIFLTPDWMTQFRTFYEDITHCRPYTVETVRDLLVMNGLEKIIAEKFYQLPTVWRFPILKALNRIMQIFIPNTVGRKLSSLIGWKYFRWAVELMILGYGQKPSRHQNNLN